MINWLTGVSNYLVVLVFKNSIPLNPVEKVDSFQPKKIKVFLTCKISRHESTFSCWKNLIILSSLNTRLLLTRLWNTLGSFLRATLLPSLGSVTLQTTPKAPYPMGRSGWKSELGLLLEVVDVPSEKRKIN